jgi:hypothetical protein
MKRFIKQQFKIALVMGTVFISFSFSGYAQITHIYNLESPAKVMLHNQQFAYIGTTGKLLFDKTFEEATDFDDGIAVVKNNGKYALIDSIGKTIKPLSANEVFVPSCGRILFEEKGKYGYYDYKGNIAITPNFVTANSFYEGVAVVCNNSNNLYGAIDAKGDLVIPCQYKRLEPFSEGCTIAQTNTKQRVYLNHKGDRAIADTFDTAYPFNEGLAIVSQGNKSFVIDKAGATQFYLPDGARYDMIFQKGVLKVYVGDKVVFYDRWGNTTR